MSSIFPFKQGTCLTNSHNTIRNNHKCPLINATHNSLLINELLLRTLIKELHSFRLKRGAHRIRWKRKILWRRKIHLSLYKNAILRHSLRRRTLFRRFIKSRRKIWKLKKRSMWIYSSLRNQRPLVKKTHHKNRAWITWNLRSSRFDQNWRNPMRSRSHQGSNLKISDWLF